MKNLSNSATTLYNWVNRLYNSFIWSNLVLKSHNILPSQIDTLVHERQLLKTEKDYSPSLYEYNLLFTTIFLETELGYLLKDAAHPNSMFFAHLCNRPPNSISFFTDG